MILTHINSKIHTHERSLREVNVLVLSTCMYVMYVFNMLCMYVLVCTVPVLYVTYVCMYVCMYVQYVKVIGNNNNNVQR